MGLLDDVNNAIAQRTNQPPTAPGGFAPAPGVGAPGYPASAGAHLGAPVPTAGMPAVFDSSFAFGGGPPQAPPPAPAPALNLPPPGQNVFGSVSTQNPAWASDGAGGWFELAQLGAMRSDPRVQALYAAPAPPTPTTFPSHVNSPEAAGTAMPTPTGGPAPTTPGGAPKKGPGRPKKDSPAPGPARDTTPAPADFSAPTVTVTLTVGSMVVTVPAPDALVDQLMAHVLGQVKG